MRVTAQEYRILTGQQKPEEPKRPRIRSKKTTVDGITFDSKREAERYLQLKTAQKAGHISKLRLQVPFSLSVDRVHVCVYKADFVYVDREGNEIVEDAKGHRTEVYLIKKKLMAACHGIEVKES
jgi:hypothetical protein